MGFCLPSGGINPLAASNEISDDPISKVLTCIQIMTSYGVNLHHVYTHKCMLNTYIYIKHIDDTYIYICNIYNTYIYMIHIYI